MARGKVLTSHWGHVNPLRRMRVMIEEALAELSSEFMHRSQRPTVCRT